MSTLSAFVGRDDERDRLRTLTETHRLVTVTGPGGVGKTRLVEEVVGADGVTLVELAPLADAADAPDAADAADRAAARLGHGSADDWLLAIADQEVTIALDGCERVPGAAALAQRLLAAGPGVRVVATSREPLAIDGEHLLVLGALDEDAAVELFLDRCLASGGAAAPEDPAVIDLCRRLDGLPLAVELAATRIRTMTPAELCRHLDRRFDLLPGLAGVIAVSYQLLDPADQRSFRRLAALPGRFSADVAHDLIGQGEADPLATVDRLAGLVDRSLLVTEPSGRATRYRLLDSLRAYGLDQLEDEGESASTQDDLASAMTAEAVRAMDRAKSSWSVDVLDAVLDQFLSYFVALDWCLAHDAEPVRAYQLMAPLWGGVHQAQHREVAKVGAAVLRRWPDDSRPERGEVAAITANAQLLAGDVDEAMTGAETALGWPGVSPLGRIVALRTLGIARRHLGDLAGAAEALDDARTEAAALRAGPFQREIGVFEAGVTARAGDIDGALAALTDVAADADDHDEPVTGSWARIEAANLLLARGQPEAARAPLTTALDIGRSAPYPWSVTTATRLLAVATVATDGWGAATADWRTAFDAAATAGDGDELAETVRAAAGAARATGADAAADGLWALVPRARALAALPELHPDEASGGRLTSVERWRRATALLDPAPPAPVPATDEGPRGSLVREGDAWQVAFGGRAVHVTHRKGVDDLAQLLARPGHEIHCLELMGGVDTGDAGPAIDDEARRAYQQRVRDLQEEIDEAAGHNDGARAERAELELDALVEELATSLGLSGRARSEKSAAERARSAVTWRIRAAVRHLEDSIPELARHLHHAIRTGTWCTYRPETAVDWTVRRQVDGSA